MDELLQVQLVMQLTKNPNCLKDVFLREDCLNMKRRGEGRLERKYPGLSKYIYVHSRPSLGPASA